MVLFYPLQTKKTMPQNAEPTVFVVDDDQAVRDSLRWLLESVGHPVESFSSALEFLASYQPEQPGCLVLDVRMPGMSGLELQEALANRHFCIPILIITGHGDISMAVQAMKDGALDFIEKPFNDQLLLDRVQNAIVQDARWRQERNEKSELKERLDQLTPREKEVLQEVVAGKPNKVVAHTLGISVKTVEIHRARAMEKMQANSLPQLVAMCIACDLHKGKP